jgi:2-succinyl-5-enolpyruvyl-6-hydroxy-3-cyclohexene-1-carboxylate synthase
MSFPASDTYRLLGAFVDELARCGMRDACTSPGSRCAPLVLSLVHEPRLHSHSHVDERCSGFFAIGLAKAGGLPVAVTCTSGTALAELLPAVVEAREARVPLIVLSADRPSELREVGAGQAIDQIKLFGGFAKWFFEVGTHEASTERIRWMRTLACRAFWTSLEGRPGVVHLNFALREPLVVDRLPERDSEGRPDGAPYLHRLSGALRSSNGLSPAQSASDHATYASIAGASLPSDAAQAAQVLRELVGGARRVLLVAGRHERPTPLGPAAETLCTAAGWPLLADPMSGARRGETAIAHYDALLRSSDFAARHTPDAVIRVGDLPVSKPLRTWLAGLGEVPQIVLDPESAGQDPASVVSHSLAAEPAATLNALSQLGLNRGQPDWLVAWRSADERAAGAILGVLAREDLSEPSVAAELGVLLPEQATLFVASSMPVRDIETFWPVRADPPRVLCNRGANGIDGTVSSAFGAAAAGRGPVVLLIGDVALAHDIGGLLAARRLHLQLTIVLIDNDGGGIFDFLPVSQSPPATSAEHYTRHIATPTGLDFSQAAALYGLEHRRVADVASLRSALEHALTESTGHSNIIEVSTDRTANVELHRRVWGAVSDAVGQRRPA